MDLEETPSKRPHHLPHNFPNIFCPSHNYPIILACIRPDCKYDRRFLCSKCLHHELDHVNKHTPLHTFDDFVNILATEDAPLLDINKIDTHGLVTQINENVSTYSDSVKREHSQIKKIVEDFNDIFQDFCGELVASLQSQLSNHSENFQEQYQKLENELLTDDLANAQLPKFKEITSEVSKIRGAEKQLDYLREILHRRQAWEGACFELKQLPKRSFEFYENLVLHQMEIEPKLQNKDELVETFTKGLQSLISKVTHQAQIGDTSIEDPQYIWLNLDNVRDLELLCDEMLRQETLLCYKPNINEDLQPKLISEYLSKLPSLRALALDFSLLPINGDDIVKAISSIPDLTNLKALDINLAGVPVQTKTLADILKQLKSCKEVRELSLNFSQNNTANFADLIEGLSDMKHLTDLNLNLSGNKLDNNVIETLVMTLRALKHLEHLGLNFSGFSLSGPVMDKKSAFKLFNCFSDLSSLKKLSLDFGNNKLNDEHFTELADHLKKISSLRHLELVINNNNLDERGARKISNAIIKSHLNWLYLNAHSNDLKASGVDELLGFLDENRKWVKVELNLRNVGVNKSQANELYRKSNKDNIKIIF